MLSPARHRGACPFPLPQDEPGSGRARAALCVRHWQRDFGLGWDLGLPRIARKTELGLPRYDSRDRFVLTGADDLVPLLRPGAAVAERVRRGAWDAERFRPRVEGLNARIERWTHRTSGDVHWRATTAANVTSIYGRTAGARIADAADATRVFAWLIEETFDALGNHLLYEYAGDDPALVVPEVYEDRRAYAQRYARRIFYANLPAGIDDAASCAKAPITPGRNASLPAAMRSEVAFDYGDGAVSGFGRRGGRALRRRHRAIEARIDFRLLGPDSTCERCGVASASSFTTAFRSWRPSRSSCVQPALRTDWIPSPESACSIQ
jgi:hypothetical protein